MITSGTGQALILSSTRLIPVLSKQDQERKSQHSCSIKTSHGCTINCMAFQTCYVYACSGAKLSQFCCSVLSNQRPFMVPTQILMFLWAPKHGCIIDFLGWNTWATMFIWFIKEINQSEICYKLFIDWLIKWVDLVITKSQTLFEEFSRVGTHEPLYLSKR